MVNGSVSVLVYFGVLQSNHGPELGDHFTTKFITLDKTVLELYLN